MNPTNEKWLTEWRLAELRDQGWWVSDWLKKAFPADWCDRIDRQFPLPGCPQRWEAFKLLLGTEGLTCRREDLTPKLSDEVKHRWRQNDCRENVGLMHAAMSAEYAEQRLRAGTHVWKGPIVQDCLKRLRKKGMVAKIGLHPTLEAKEKGIIQRLYLVQFWFIGSPLFVNRLPFCVMSQQAILDMMGHFSLTTGTSKEFPWIPPDRLDCEVLKKYIRRLQLYYAVPRSRFVRRIRYDARLRCMIPV